MRKIIVVILSLCTFSLSAFNASDKIEKAIYSLGQGYISYAVAQLEQAVAVNDIYAQYYMGICYENGIGVPINSEQAFKMYRRAAERGFVPAMSELSRCYSVGIGVAVNSQKASEWLSRLDKRQNDVSVVDIVALYTSLVTDPDNANDNPEMVLSGNRNLHNSVPLTQNNSMANYPVKTMTQPVSIPMKSISKSSESYSKSDVDIEIPSGYKKSENSFAIIIANENYQDVAKVPNAINDGEIFAEYCKLTLGMPATNVHLIKDATLNNIKREINLMKQLAEAYKGNASFIIYYAGHGIPDEKTRESYLMPVDGFGTDISTCFKLSDLYEVCGQMPSRKNIIFLDACFSGSIRGEGMIASARGVAIKSKVGAPRGNSVVISSAQGDETAYPYDEKKHGLFTYYLLKNLKDSKGEAKLGSLLNYIKDNVSKKSLVVNGKSQTPCVNPSQDVVSEWTEWSLN